MFHFIIKKGIFRYYRKTPASVRASAPQCIPSCAVETKKKEGKKGHAVGLFSPLPLPLSLSHTLDFADPGEPMMGCPQWLYLLVFLLIHCDHQALCADFNQEHISAGKESFTPQFLPALLSGSSSEQVLSSETCRWNMTSLLKKKLSPSITYYSNSTSF